MSEQVAQATRAGGVWGAHRGTVQLVPSAAALAVAKEFAATRALPPPPSAQPPARPVQERPHASIPDTVVVQIGQSGPDDADAGTEVIDQTPKKLLLGQPPPAIQLDQP